MDSPFRRLIPLTVFFITITLLASFAMGSTPEPPAIPRDYVVDLAGIMEGSVKSQLNAVLQELERKTSIQALVLTVRSLDGQSMEEFALNTKEKWKLGQKGKDNGLLIVVAVQDRKYRIEVGYGLEGILPDSLVGSIGRDYFVPYFRKGDYGTGLTSGTLAVIRTIAAHENVEITGMPTPRGLMVNGRPTRVSPFQVVVLAVFFVIALILFVKNPHQCLLLMLVSSMGGGRGGWSGGGGGFGGGGGSFGGGGGGSGGGGGASGSW